jgi:predicted DNA-binding transcriptional regulator YafY
MESFEPKKLALIRILQILEKHSDCEHPMKHDTIVELLESEYGLILERKAIGRNISLLCEAGYDIQTTKKGAYLAERTFEDSELRLLIDGVLSSGYITAKHSKDLIERLCAQSNRYFRPRVKNIYSVNDWNKTENVSVFYTIEIVDEAIERGRQVRFEYNKYGADKKLHRTSKQTLSPYQMILHNQRYYLMGYNEKWQEMRYYRMDRITNIVILDEPSTPLRSIKGFESGIDYKRFSSALPYMFADEPKMSAVRRFALTGMLLNFLARPDYISYSHAHPNTFLLRICRDFLHTPCLIWTVRTPAQQQTCHPEAAIIFENFIPE